MPSILSTLLAVPGAVGRVRASREEADRRRAEEARQAAEATRRQGADERAAAEDVLRREFLQRQIDAQRREAQRPEPIDPYSRERFQNEYQARGAMEQNLLDFAADRGVSRGGVRQRPRGGAGGPSRPIERWTENELLAAARDFGPDHPVGRAAEDELQRRLTGVAPTNGGAPPAAGAPAEPPNDPESAYRAYVRQRGGMTVPTAPTRPSAPLATPHATGRRPITADQRAYLESIGAWDPTRYEVR